MSEREQWERAIATLEAQRAILGDAVVEAMLAAARERLAALDQPQSSEQRKQVTVLFADISGFTGLVEAMDPEEVHETVNSLWSRLDTIITARGGMIDKHMGDSVLALWGTGAAREDDPEQAIRAALEMQAEVGGQRAEVGRQMDLLAGTASEQAIRRPTYDLRPLTSDFHLRIGIHTGPVLLGRVGTTAEYTATGDTVNLASRLQNAAPPGQVLVSHDTYRHVRGIFDVQALPPLVIKGKKDPVQVYLISGTKPRAFRVMTRGVEGIETPMIGREEELHRLQKTITAAIQEKRMRTVTILGEGGVGKSRLLYEFTNWVDLLPDNVRLFRGRTDPRMSQLPYSLIRDVFTFRFEMLDTDPAAVTRRKLEEGVVSFMGPEGVEKAHFIGHLLGFDFSESPYLRGILDDARQIRDRAFHYLVQFFQSVTSTQAAMLCLEDVHWADSGSLEMIEHLDRCGVEMPLLIICLARPNVYEAYPSWGKDIPHHTRLELRPLSEPDSTLLVCEILRQVPRVPSDLLTFVVTRAEGNPFYIEELIKVLIEHDVIVKGEDRWEVRPEQLAEVGVPATLAGVLQARLDRLPPLERQIIQWAAVVGRTFWDGAVAHIGMMDREEVCRALRVLREKEWIFERGSSVFEGEYECVFKHALLHEVTYESVLKRHRRSYHAELASWLIDRAGERAEEYAGLIASHYENAREVALASEWYGRAGQQAQESYAPETAVRYYQKSLTFLQEAHGSPAQLAARQVVLYEGLGDALGRLGRFTESAAAYESMREAAEAAGDQAAQAHAWERLAWVQDSQGDYYGALASTGKAEEVARAAGDRLLLVQALLRQGRAKLELGDPEAASALAEETLALSTELNDPREMARSLNLLGAIACILGRYEQAAGYMERALALHRELGIRPGVASSLTDLATNATLYGDYGAAVGLYQEALAVFREIGHRDGEVVCRSNLGGARVALGEYEAAEADLRQVIQLAEGNSWFLSETYHFLAEACLGQGKLEEALAAARWSLALGQEIGQQEFVGGAWRALGMVAARMGAPIEIAANGSGLRPYDAPSCFAESLRVFTEMGAEGERARTLRAWARYELERGDSDRGEEMWAEARGIFERLGMGMEVERMRDR